MASLSRCAQCGSFVVTGNCPNCGGGKLSATRMGALATLFGSTAFAMTLMACYGCPDCGDYTGPYDGGPDSGRDAKASSSSSSSSGGAVDGGDDDDVSEPKDAGEDSGDSGIKDAGADG